MLEADEMATIDRIATVIRMLYGQQHVTTAIVAEQTGCTRQNAWYMLNRLSSSLPIYEHEGAWRLLE